MYLGVAIKRLNFVNFTLGLEGHFVTTKERLLRHSRCSKIFEKNL